MAENQTRICSWDVGIKNLAYCIILKENNTFKIEHWDIINLVEEDNQVVKCSAVNKNKKECTSNSKFIYQLNNISHGLCNKHKDVYQPEVIEYDFIKYENKEIVACQHNNKDCKSIVKWLDNLTNKYYCTIHKSTLSKAKPKNTLKKIKSKNCMHESILILAKRLYTELNKINNIFSNVSEFVIENQPTLINPTMKSISMLVYGYFVNKFVNKTDNNWLVSNIRLYSPSNKLKKIFDDNETDKNIKIKPKKTIKSKIVIDGDDIAVIAGNTSINDKTIQPVKPIVQIKDTHSYKMNKIAAVKYCQLLLKDKPDSLACLNAKKKKDDMADSFLQGYHYLFCRETGFQIDKEIYNQLKDLLIA